MKIDMKNTRVVTYSEYRDLLGLYIKQMGKTADLQDANIVLHNLVLELRDTVDILKKRDKK